MFIVKKNIHTSLRKSFENYVYSIIIMHAVYYYSTLNFAKMI